MIGGKPGLHNTQRSYYDLLLLVQSSFSDVLDLYECVLLARCYGVDHLGRILGRLEYSLWRIHCISVANIW